ncbi:MAG: DNA polymerase III subunit delta [Alphaproteobacteria bacterium]|nr:DNA polymerase III subunit delta [Alphaproteobacteria bacterium]MBT7942915.1 DNA polymerase III subunit delta [Alphaproteobacteria bacterium]
MKVTGARLASFLRQPGPEISAVLLFGPEQGLVRERGSIIAKTVVDDLSDPFRVVEFSGGALKADPPLLGDEAAQLSMIGGRRVIRVVDAVDGVSNIFATYLETPSQQTLVIAEAGNLTPRSSLRKLFEGSKSAASIGCYEDSDGDLRSVVQESLGRFGLTASADAMAFLVEHLGANRLVTRNELEKLALYVNGGRPEDAAVVSLDDAIACIGDSAAMSLDLVVYAAAGGDSQGLDRALAKAFDDGTSPIGILRALQRHLQNLHVTIGKVESGMPPDKALFAIRPPINFKFKPQFQAQLRNWRQDRLVQALDLITETEMDCKSTGFPAAAGCHRALMRVAQAARVRR